MKRVIIAIVVAILLAIGIIVAAGAKGATDDPTTIPQGFRGTVIQRYCDGRIESETFQTKAETWSHYWKYLYKQTQLKPADHWYAIQVEFPRREIGVFFICPPGTLKGS